MPAPDLITVTVVLAPSGIVPWRVRLPAPPSVKDFDPPLLVTDILLVSVSDAPESDCMDAPPVDPANAKGMLVDSDAPA